MEFYLAPLEGITGYIYRNTVRDMFGNGIDKYFTPFIEPHMHKKNLTHRELNDILPEHNQAVRLVPQVLTNSAESFNFLEQDLKPYGYKELNINLGCPSSTVVTKGRGSALLKPENRQALTELLDGIFEKTDCEISLKTRIGYANADDWSALLELFNKYPLKELIIHVRSREEMYEGRPHYEAFSEALKTSVHRLCYNGDIKDPESYREAMEYFRREAGREPDAVMIGRGMLMNPKLISGLSCGEGTMTAGELRDFTERLLGEYKLVLFGEATVLNKMKEIWTWIIKGLPDREPVRKDKLLKKIMKAKKYPDYLSAAEEVYRSL